MSRKPGGKRVLVLLLCLWMILPGGGCRSRTQPSVSTAATESPPAIDVDMKPVLRDFLANLPADWNQVFARDVAKARPFVVDVRQPEDYAKGFIEGALNIGLRDLALSLRALPSMDRDVVVVCNSGHRAAIGMAVLQLLGYKKARSLEGGMHAWRQANLPVVSGPIPNRPAGQAPAVNEQLQAILAYYLAHTLPADEGAISPAGLTEEQDRGFSLELGPLSDAWDQGRSLLVDVDEPDEFVRARLFGAVNLPLRDLPDGLDSLPLQEATNPCKVPATIQLEPQLTKFVVVSTSGHRAAIGMMSMQLIGFHFVKALEGGLSAWNAVR